jgi:hypothetical protein
VEAFDFASTFILELQVVYKCTYNQRCWHSMNKTLDLWEACVHCASIKHRFHHITNGHWWCYGCTCATWISSTCNCTYFMYVNHEHFQYLFKIRYVNYGVHNRSSNYKKTNHNIVWSVYSNVLYFWLWNQSLDISGHFFNNIF